MYSLESVYNTKGVKVLHANVRSVLQHHEEIRAILECNYLDIVVLTESWLHANCLDSLIAIKGYNHYRLDRQTVNKNGTPKKGGGIIIYIKENHSVLAHSILDCSDKDLEVISVSCKIGNHKKINLSAVYRPPSGNVQVALDKLGDCKYNQIHNLW